MRSCLARMLLPAVLLCLLTAAPAAAQSPDGRPNFVVLMTDDQTVRDLRVMPDTRRLIAGEGVTFRNSFVSYPVCCPSKATFLSGQYAHNHRVMGLYPPTGGYRRFDKRSNLPVWLERAGYHTAHVGKYMNGYGSDVPATVPAGWSDWYGGLDSSIYRMWGYTLNENGSLRTYGRPFQEEPRLYQTDVLRDKAVGVIERQARAGRPLFLSMAFLAPHHESRGIQRRTGVSVRSAPRHRGRFAGRPLPRPAGFNEADVSDKPRLIRRRPRLRPRRIRAMAAEHRARLESLLAVDEAVTEIVEALRRTGELDNTYLLLTSDNGYMQGQHRVPSGKMLPYDPASRVPLLLRGPGLAKGRGSRELVANVDLAPTILAAAGVRAGKVMDGRSLLPFARRPGLRSRRLLLHETGGRAYFDRREQDGAAFRRLLSYRGVRSSRWLYVRYRSGTEELYDMARDPAQLRSRHADPRYRRTRLALRSALRRLKSCRGSRCRAAGRRIPPPTRQR